MSLHYLIDGYNVINQISQLDRQKLETQRESFVKLIEIGRPQGKLTNGVTVVFDGQIDITSPLRPGPIKIVFSKGESADDKIKKIVRAAENKKNIVVITDDRDIQYAVRADGASVLTAKEFIRKLPLGCPSAQPNQNKVKKISQTLKKNISKSAESKITEELKNIWLKEQ